MKSMLYRAVILVVAFVGVALADTYTYDEHNRITSVDYGSGKSIVYSYDKVGNRSQVVISGPQAPAPVISVTPTVQTFGTVVVGDSSDRTVAVENTGTGALIGDVTAAAPFSVVSGGSYNLGAGESQNVTLRFSPSSEGDYSQNVAFSGGGGATCSVTGMAVKAQYTLTFDSAGGTSVSPISQAYGSSVTAPTSPSRTGYTFTGWSPAVPSTMPAEDRTHVAQWTVNSYTLTFNSAGGTSVSPITQAHGTSVDAPASPNRTGYTFAGWSPPIPSTMPAEDRTLTAQWAVNSYTLTFNSAGGSSVSPITQAYGTSVAAPASPTRTGYAFAGWSPPIPSTIPAVNQTHVAQWTLNELTISPTTRSHANTASSGQMIAVTANVAWTAVTSASWITITGGASGANNGTVTYNVSANTGAARSGDITVSGGGMTRTFTLNQAASPGSGGGTAVRLGAFSKLVGLTMSISVTPEAGTTTWSLEEFLPAGLTPSDISGPNGNWNASTRKITWSGNGDAPQFVTYILAGAPGVYDLVGSATFGAVNVAVTGGLPVWIPDGWQPMGWVYLDWPWAYDQASDAWYWFNIGDIQNVYGFAPADGWQQMNASGLAQGWVYFSWPSAYSLNVGSWYYVNEPDVHWVVNMALGRWYIFGLAPND